jgi:transposase
MTTAYIGIDLHRTVIQLCVLDERGERIAEERIRYQSLEEGAKAVAFVKRFGPGCRVAVEALGLNRWFVNACLEAGLDVLVCDPRKLDLKKLGKKTDRRDAREIARRLWLGEGPTTRATRSTAAASCCGSATDSSRCASRPSTSCGGC